MNKFLKCFLIEDEPLAVRQISSYINTWDQLELIGNVYDVENQEEFLPELLKCDILFLDLIVMGGDLSFLVPYLAKIENIVIISALPPSDFPSYILNKDLFILTKPITRVQFDSCITKIITG